VEGLGALLDTEEVLAEVVLFTIVSELLIHESDEGSRSGKDPRISRWCTWWGFRRTF
jgi:hypothetical protein